MKAFLEESSLFKMYVYQECQGGEAVGEAVAKKLEILKSHIGMLVFRSRLCVNPAALAQVPGSLPNTWKTLSVFLVPGFGLAHPSLL